MSQLYKLTIPTDRTERLQYIRRMFPQAAGPHLNDKWRGGRLEALRRLNTLDAQNYARNRNFINGSVTHLSPYLRHGCVSLFEAVELVKNRFGVDAEKLVQELAWRDFFRRVWYLKGDEIFSDLEEAKVPLGDKPLPDFIRQGITGLPCMDAFIRELNIDGYMHNHARMWFAAYVVHWLKVDWRDAANWFENLLLDGDKASNHLSWQWVAALFASKPYYFNKENLARYTGEKYCTNCKIKCPFDDTYENLNEKLFNQTAHAPNKVTRIATLPPSSPPENQALAVFVHDEMLSPANPILRRPLPKIFVFDENIHSKWPLKRLQFMADCINELQDVEVWLGDTRAVLNQRGVGQVVTQQTPNRQIHQLLLNYKPLWQEEKPLSPIEMSEKRLKRFSRYWEKMGPEILWIA